MSKLTRSKLYKMTGGEVLFLAETIGPVDNRIHALEEVCAVLTRQLGELKAARAPLSPHEPLEVLLMLDDMDRKNAGHLERYWDVIRHGYEDERQLLKTTYDPANGRLTMQFSDRMTHTIFVPTREAAIAEVQSFEPDFRPKP